MLIWRIPVLPVLISAIVTMAVGMAWYSPLLFGKSWMALSGIDPKKAAEDCKKKSMAITYLVSFLSGLLMAAVLGYVLTRSFSASGVDAARKGILCWAGFVAPALLGGVLWEGKPAPLYAINAGYYLVTMVLSSLIIVSMI